MWDEANEGVYLSRKLIWLNKIKRLYISSDIFQNPKAALFQTRSGLIKIWVLFLWVYFNKDNKHPLWKPHTFRVRHCAFPWEIYIIKREVNLYLSVIL